MRKIFRHLTIVFLLIAFKGAFGKDVGIIHGKVIDSKINRGLGLVRIVLRIPDGHTLQAISQPDGSFILKAPFIENGFYYSLQIVKKGYILTNLDEIHFQANKQKDMVIHMEVYDKSRAKENSFAETAIKNYVDRLLRNKNTKEHQDSLTSLYQQIKTGIAIIKNISTTITKIPLKQRSKKDQELFGCVLNGDLDQAQKKLQQESDVLTALNNIATTEQQLKLQTAAIFEKAKMAIYTFDYDTADKFFGKVVKIDPANINYISEYAAFLIFNRNDFKSSQRALALLKTISLSSIKSDNIRSHFYNCYGAAYHNLNQPDSSKYFYEKNLRLEFLSGFSYKEIIYNQALANNNMGALFYGLNDSLAVNYFAKANANLQELATKTGYRDTSLAALITSNIGNTYCERGDKSLALKYFDKGLKLIYQKRYNDHECLSRYISLQIDYNKLAYQLNPQKSYLDDIAPFLDTLHSLNVSKKYHYPFLIEESNYATTLGYAYQKTDSVKALNYFKRALTINKKMLADTNFEVNSRMASSYYNLLQFYKMRKMLSEMKVFADSAKYYYALFNNTIDANLQLNSTRYLDKKSDYFLSMARVYAELSDTTSQFDMLTKADITIGTPKQGAYILWKDKIMIYNALSAYFSNKRNFSLAIKYAENSLNIYRDVLKNNFTNDIKISDCYENISGFYYNQHREDETKLIPSIEFATKAENIIKSNFPDDTAFYGKRLARNYNRTADTYNLLKKNNESIFYYKKSIQAYTRSLSWTLDEYDYICLINNYLSLSNADAGKYLDAGYHILTNKFPSKSSEYYYLTLGQFYNEYGAYYRDIRHRQDSSVYYYRLAVKTLDTLYRKNKKCLECWIVSRYNLANALMMDKTISFDLLKGNFEVIEHDIGIDSLHKVFHSPTEFIPGMYLNLGIDYFNLNKIDSAIILADKAFAILKKYPRPDHAQPDDIFNTYYSNVGYYYIVLRQYDKAVSLLQKCFSDYPVPKAFGNYTNLTFAYLFSNQLGKSKRLLQEFKKKYPSETDMKEFKNSLQSDFEDYQKRQFDGLLLEKFKLILDNYN